MNSRLFLKILKRIESVAGVEVLVVLAMTAFHLAIMSWRESTDLLVLYTELRQRFLFAVAHLVGLPLRGHDRKQHPVRLPERDS